jgi:2-dehydropantoate 2-reductase
MLGRADGRVTPAVLELQAALRDAKMAPRLCADMVAYIRTHFMWAAGSVGAFMKAGSWDRFVTRGIQSEAYRAMREAWEICMLQGIDPLRVSPTRYFYLPLFILVPFTLLMYRNKAMKRMFEGHIAHSPDEVKVMYETVLKLGEHFGLDMPVFRGFKPWVDLWERTAAGT